MNEQGTVTDWQAYPMGPKLRKWLDLGPEAGFAGRPSEGRKVEFGSWLMQSMETDAVKLQSADPEVVKELADELVAMDLPLVALKLIDMTGNRWTRHDFAGAFAEGVAAMQAQELERAEECFRTAHEFAPLEPAPYVNLVQIMLFQGRFEEARQWCEAGLSAEPNNFNLWDVLTEIEMRSSTDFNHRSIVGAAERFQSWAGASLGADLDPAANSQTKAAALDAFYTSGERAPEFLIEYTGALGAAGDFERIPQIIWQAEKLSKAKLPWKLRLHAAQAHLAMNQLDRFAAVLDRMRHDPDVPANIMDELDRILTEEANTENQGVPH